MSKKWAVVDFKKLYGLVEMTLATTELCNPVVYYFHSLIGVGPFSKMKS